MVRPYVGCWPSGTATARVCGSGNASAALPLHGAPCKHAAHPRGRSQPPCLGFIRCVASPPRLFLAGDGRCAATGRTAWLCRFLSPVTLLQVGNSKAINDWTSYHSARGLPFSSPIGMAYAAIDQQRIIAADLSPHAALLLDTPLTLHCGISALGPALAKSPVVYIIGTPWMLQPFCFCISILN